MDGRIVAKLRGIFRAGRWIKGNCLRSVSFLQASCANVTAYFLSVFYVRNFLYVYLERSSRFTVGVAHVITRSLTFTANITYSGHIDTSVLSLFTKICSRIKTRKIVRAKTSIITISSI